MIKKLFFNFKDFCRKEISFDFSVNSILRAVFKFTILFILSFIVLIFTNAIAVDGLSKIKQLHYVYMSLGSFFIIMGYYAQNYFFNIKREKSHKINRTALSLIDGLLLKICESGCSKEKKSFVENTLRIIERIVKSSLNIRTDNIEIVASLFIYDSSKKKLKLKYFGTQVTGRKYISLKVDENEPLPGAPTSFITQQIVYIKDIEDPKIVKYFKNKERNYKSLISVPLINKNDNVWGILCIDSTRINEFKSKEFIQQIIRPSIISFISLINLKLNKF